MENLHTAQYRSNNQTTSAAALIPLDTQQTLYTVRQFAQKERAFSESALRNHIHNAQPRKSANGVIPGNGLIECGAIVRVGRKVLLHGERFLQWVEQDGSAKHLGRFHE